MQKYIIKSKQQQNAKQYTKMQANTKNTRKCKTIHKKNKTMHRIQENLKRNTDTTQKQ